MSDGKTTPPGPLTGPPGEGSSVAVPILVGLLPLLAMFTLLWTAIVNAVNSSPASTAISVAVPVVIGALIGLVVRRARIVTVFLAVTATCLAIATVAMCLLFQGAAGVFCAVVFTVAAIPPALLGLLCGIALRQHLERRRRRERANAPDRRALLWPMLALAGAPLAVQGYEQAAAEPYADERLVFTRTIAAAAEDLWQTSLAFDAPNSSWQHVHAPLPQRASGRATAVGDEKALQFAKGVLRVRIVAVEPGRSLVAEVLEQTIEARALRLHRVTFAVAPRSAASCDVSITLEHTPLMGPRWHWRPYEQFFGGITFDAIVEDLLAPRPARHMADAR